MANDFLPFAGGVGANVLTQSAYAALAARTAGFSAGVAKSAELNKVWRQSSIMSAVLAQLVADNTGADVLDDGTTATILANLKIAVSGRLIGIQVFTANGTYTPTPGTKSVMVEAIGGGGAGGGAGATSVSTMAAGSGGHAGAYGLCRYTSGFSGAIITIGAGGTAAAAGANNGGNGGTTSFGALMSCPGGLGGMAGVAATPPFINGATPASGALPSGANLAATSGQPGSYGLSLNTGTGPSGGSNLAGGFGGSSQYGAGGHAPNGTGSRQGYGYGSGSSGASNAISSGAQPSIAGRPGILIVYEYA